MPLSSWLIATIAAWVFYALLGVASSVVVTFDKARIARDYPVTKMGPPSRTAIWLITARLLWLGVAVLLSALAAMLWVLNQFAESAQ